MQGIYFVNADGERSKICSGTQRIHVATIDRRAMTLFSVAIEIGLYLHTSLLQESLHCIVASTRALVLRFCRRRFQKKYAKNELAHSEPNRRIEECFTNEA